MRQSMTEAWTKWRAMVSEQIASGQSVAAFCDERGVRVSACSTTGRSDCEKRKRHSLWKCR